MTREQQQKQRALDLLRQRYYSGTLRHQLMTVDPRVRWQPMPVDVEESKRRNRLSPHPCLEMDIERKASDYAAWLKQK